jgi:hypothetical protein
VRVGLTHIEPVMAEKIAERLCGPRETFISPEISWTKPAKRSIFDDDFDEDEVIVKRRKPDSDEKYALLLRKRRDDMVARRRILVGFPASLLTLGFYGLGYWINPRFPAIGIGAAVVGTGVALFGTWFALRWSSMASQRRALKYELILEELTCVQPYLEMNAAESAYFDILVMLTRLEANLEARRILRKLMDTVNSILVCSREIDAALHTGRPASRKRDDEEETARPRRSLFSFGDDSDDDDDDEEYAAGDPSSSDTRSPLSEEEIYADLQAAEALPALAPEKPVRESVRILEQQQEAIVKALQMVNVALSRITVAPGPLAEKSSKQITDIAASVKRKTEEAISAARNSA